MAPHGSDRDPHHRGAADGDTDTTPVLTGDDVLAAATHWPEDAGSEAEREEQLRQVMETIQRRRDDR